MSRAQMQTNPSKARASERGSGTIAMATASDVKIPALPSVKEA